MSIWNRHHGYCSNHTKESSRSN